MLQAGSAQNTLVGLGRKPVPPSTTQGHALHGVSLLVTETPQGCPLLLKTSCGPRPVTELYLVRGSGHICGSQSCLCLPLRRREGRAGRRGGKEEEREGGKETVFGGCLQRDQPSMRESFTMSSATSRTSLPSGLAVFTTFPDVLFIPEMVSASFSLGRADAAHGSPSTLSAVGVQGMTLSRQHVVQGPRQVPELQASGGSPQLSLKESHKPKLGAL